MKLETKVIYTLSYKNIFDDTKNIISDNFKFDSTETLFANTPVISTLTPLNKVTFTRIVNLYDIDTMYGAGGWKIIAQKETDSFSFYISDKIPTLDNITDALNTESTNRKPYVTINWKYVSALPQQTKKMIVEHISTLKYPDSAYGFNKTNPRYESEIYVRKLNKKDIIINAKGHEIWPQKTGNIPSELVRLFKKNYEPLEIKNIHNANTK